MANRSDCLISTELLRDLLQLPEDITIVGRPDGNLLITLEGDRLPNDTPEVLPTWVKKGDKTEFLKFEPVNIPAVPA